MKRRRPRSISDIRNPWLRHGVVVLIAPFAAVAYALFGVAIALLDMTGDIQAAWRGPRGR